MKYPKNIGLSEWLTEVVPAFLITGLCGVVIYAYTQEPPGGRDKFNDWATSLISLYIGKALSDQNQDRQNRKERYYAPDQ
jgi:uncharacterized membrane protein